MLLCMLTVLEAAARLGKDPETIRRWIRSGKLPARKVGLQHLIDEGDLPDEPTDLAASLPPGWGRTKTGEPMPELAKIVSVLRRQRREH